MQKEFINGVPYFRDKTNIYLSTEPTVQIGTYTDEHLEFYTNHLNNLQERLTLWRSEQRSRIRKPTIPSARKSRNTKAGVTEVPDTDT
jgi:hypothetical protein